MINDNFIIISFKIQLLIIPLKNPCYIKNIYFILTDLKIKYISNNTIKINTNLMQFFKENIIHELQSNNT